MSEPQSPPSKNQQQQQAGRGSRGRRRSRKKKNSQSKNDQQKSEDGNMDMAVNVNDEVVVPQELKVWFQESLQTLGYPDTNTTTTPSVVVEGALNGDEKMFQRTVQYLEDRCIRLWDLDRRNAILRPTTTSSSFWKQLALYLNDLECPTAYYCSSSFSADDNDGHNHGEEQLWHTDASKRWRVLHWIVTCALQEAYNDTSNDDETNPHPFATTTVTATTITTDTALNSTTTTNSNNNESLADSLSVIIPSSQSFPLGFSTGDPQVDEIVTVLRMQFIAEMQDEQAAIHKEIIIAATSHSQQQQQPKKQQLLKKKAYNTPPRRKKTPTTKNN